MCPVNPPVNPGPIFVPLSRSFWSLILGIEGSLRVDGGSRLLDANGKAVDRVVEALQLISLSLSEGAAKIQSKVDVFQETREGSRSSDHI